ncbi:Putative SOS response-associated peptidase YedK [Parafrankia irregularis]|uniref:Abasic site processing protein n=1 Tax=Parafrankia irregularis TaxID=795642 RepID=A0A0S4QDV8_9ACTN|nr:MULTISPECIES: SOS response-associated peptidase [Parafrankia]MBE3199578.1 SOS response-associated peptidase [Parafrankia sp. CH37]CUU53755.1 Putative SOS response-associated peptidase YedK [Parafrankia irregularis]
MCGRYTQTLSADDLAAAMSAVDETHGALRESYNVAPTTAMPIVMASARPAGADRSAAGADSAQVQAAADPGRVLRLATWGLEPRWGNTRQSGNRMINARAETVASRPAFRSAFAARRCLVPATGFYEWQRVAGKRRGQPYYVHPAGHPGADGLFAFAGIYESGWHHGKPLATFAIITTEAATGLEFLHDRSPVVVPRSAWSRWIDPEVRDRADLAGVLRPVPAGVFAAHPVSSAVGSVRNDSPHLIDPVVLAEEGESTGIAATALDGIGDTGGINDIDGRATMSRIDGMPAHEGTLFDEDGARPHVPR